MARQRTQLSVAPGEVISLLSKEEVAMHFREWESAFPADRRDIHIEDYAWHVFSSMRYASVSGEAAIAEYNRHESLRYVVLSNDRDQGLITDQRPTSVSISDYLVCPINWAWTMAFTHEDGWLGPYFARHRDYDKLEIANRLGLRKRDESAAAKENGWSR
jgi:hypothetical protein